ncbi:hypothetical protein [Prauserella muralis]|uniref:Uncharacterized protein n=1 Tax=Prauserella muralis TaxID=588067 RepID=A0A2V4AIZ4_9PSEU|nr:hypothetical protein [Prauserella muralis]PXY19560.1 hypothetical protein BAY60_33060 [Prauserella muralis]TWE29551.1 hypothetical protein FHX69_2236 [Prauserella muralis]
MRLGRIVLSLLVAGSVVAVLVVAAARSPSHTERSPLSTGLEPTLHSTTPTAVSPSPSPSPLPRHERAELATAVTEAVTRLVPGTEIGLAVHDRLTGSLLTSHNADRPFYTASVVKLLIAAHVLREAGWRVPEGPERDNLTAMLADSADWVASALWEAHGGPRIDRQMAELMGLSHTAPPAVASQWELTTMSPRDVLAVYDYLDTEMPERAAGFVLGALNGAQRLALDGFDQHFGIPAALPGTDHAIKQGWMRIDDGLVLNTTGVVGSGSRYVVALLTRQPGSTGYAEGRAAVTAGIAALAETLAAEAS